MDLQNDPVQDIDSRRRIKPLDPAVSIESLLMPATCSEANSRPGVNSIQHVVPHGARQKPTRVLRQSKAKFSSFFSRISIDIDNFASLAESWL